MAFATAFPETRFRAMGTDAHVVVVGGPARLLDRSRALVDDLDRRWSRFRGDSELTRLNAAAGRPVVVSPETYALLDRAVRGWLLTSGSFDPTVLPAVLSAGYDRDFADVRDESPEPAGRARPAPGCAGIVLDPDVCSVTLPAVVAIDSGGIGKGLAADFVVADLLAEGATGACVNLGGDLRVGGEGPDDGSWLVEVEAAVSRPVLALAAGGVATSSRMRRRWRRAGVDQHHLIDPATGRPARASLGAVTVLAAEAWRAEVLATAATLPGSAGPATLITGSGATGLLIDAAGAMTLLPGLDPFLA